MSNWTEARVSTLKLMIGKNESLNAIGRALGLKRGAIAGKINRLGLTRNPEEALFLQTEGPRKHRAPSVKRNAKVNSAVSLNLKSDTPLPSSDPDVPFLDQHPTARPWVTRRWLGECAFPVGKMGLETYSCCRPTIDEATYCRGHKRIMYAPKVARVKKVVAG